MVKTKYIKSTITPQTRLIDLVNVKYHKELKVMIDELRRITQIKESEEWWQVKKLIFTRPNSMSNYEPIARFIMHMTQNGNKGLNCSTNTFFHYITSSNHSNLNVKYKSAKSLVYSIIRYLKENKNGIF